VQPPPHYPHHITMLQKSESPYHIYVSSRTFQNRKTLRCLQRFTAHRPNLYSKPFCGTSHQPRSAVLLGLPAKSDATPPPPSQSPLCSAASPTDTSTSNLTPCHYTDIPDRTNSSSVQDVPWSRTDTWTNTRGRCHYRGWLSR